MTVPVLVIVTSRQCGHCLKLRGAGHLSKRLPRSFPNPQGNGWGWNEEFFLALLRGGMTSGPARLRVFEINFEDLSGKLDQVSSFSEFSIEDSHIRRQAYYNSSDRMIYSNEVGDDPIISLQKVDNYGFYEYLNAMFPSEIADFIHPYPGFIFASQYAWGRAIRKEEPLYALSGKFPTRRKTGGIGFEVNSDIHPGVIDPVALAREIVEQPERLIPKDEIPPYYPGTLPRHSPMIMYH